MFDENYNNSGIENFKYFSHLLFELMFICICIKLLKDNMQNIRFCLNVESDKLLLQPQIFVVLNQPNDELGK